MTDEALLGKVHALARQGQRLTAELLVHLAEVDRRRLYADRACSSLHVYCTRYLGLSAQAAFKRIRVARAARHYPLILELVASGEAHLSGLMVLVPHLTPDNHEPLLRAVRAMSRDEVEKLVATHFPKEDVPDRIRKVPVRKSGGSLPGAAAAAAEGTPAGAAAAAGAAAQQAPRAAPPKGKTQPEARGVGERAPVGGRSAGAASRSRYTRTGVRRQVWERDEGRCAYVDGEGHRCGERHHLELDHIVPHGLGGPSIPENLRLLCRAHNRAEAERAFGKIHVQERIRASRQDALAQP